MDNIAFQRRTDKPFHDFSEQKYASQRACLCILELGTKKLIAVTFILMLSGCSDLTSVERKLTGYWVWEIENNGFKDKGYLQLRNDRTYVTEYSALNPTETIEFKNKYDDKSYWREREQKVCTATSWEEGYFFHRVVVKEEICLWDIVEDSTGNITLKFSDGFTKGGVLARVLDNND